MNQNRIFDASRATLRGLASKHSLAIDYETIVGILQDELAVNDFRSIKDKRRLVQSLKGHLHRNH